MNFIPKITYTELNTGTPKTIIFDSPPEGDPLREKLIVKQSNRRSSSGVRQTQHDYNIQRLSINFIFQSEVTKLAFEDFFYNHAAQGGSFNYFESEDEAAFEVFELLIGDVTIGRPIPSAVLGEFEYDFRFIIERVL